MAKRSMFVRVDVTLRIWISIGNERSVSWGQRDE